MSTRRQRSKAKERRNAQQRADDLKSRAWVYLTTSRVTDLYFSLWEVAGALECAEGEAETVLGELVKEGKVFSGGDPNRKFYMPVRSRMVAD